MEFLKIFFPRIFLTNNCIKQYKLEIIVLTEFWNFVPLNYLFSIVYTVFQLCRYTVIKKSYVSRRWPFWKTCLHNTENYTYYKKKKLTFKLVFKNLNFIKILRFFFSTNHCRVNIYVFLKFFSGLPLCSMLVCCQKIIFFSVNYKFYLPKYNFYLPDKTLLAVMRILNSF